MEMAKVGSSNLFRLVLAVVLVGGCSSVPEQIRRAPAAGPALAEARADPQRFAGSEVRWGGTIAEVENREAETWLVIVSRRLAADGEPRDLDRSEGRFIASVPGFLDPAIYAPNRSVTVTGELAGIVERPIGKYNYSFPLIETTGYYLWPEIREWEGFPPAWYDPWHCYPYYRHPWGPTYCW